MLETIVLPGKIYGFLRGEECSDQAACLFETVLAFPHRGKIPTIGGVFALEPGSTDAEGKTTV